jgi:hypothetical protein
VSRVKGLAGEAHAEALDEAGHARGIHLERIALAELAEHLRTRLGDATKIHQLREELLEAGRGDDLKYPARLVAGIPERVPLADIGCSTSEKPPSLVPPSSMKRTPMLPKNPALPSVGPTTRLAAVCIASSFH